MTTATQQPTPIDLDRPIPRGEGHINSITLRMEAGAVADRDR